jgi:hypothetical protein
MACRPKYRARELVAVIEMLSGSPLNERFSSRCECGLLVNDARQGIAMCSKSAAKHFRKGGRPQPRVGLLPTFSADLAQKDEQNTRGNREPTENEYNREHPDGSASESEL